MKFPKFEMVKKAGKINDKTLLYSDNSYPIHKMERKGHTSPWFCNPYIGGLYKMIM